MQDGCASSPDDGVCTLGRQGSPASHVVRRDRPRGDEHAALGHDQRTSAYRMVDLRLAQSLFS
jgi:hypothetical protein